MKIFLITILICIFCGHTNLNAQSKYQWTGKCQMLATSPHIDLSHPETLPDAQFRIWAEHEKELDNDHAARMKIEMQYIDSANARIHEREAAWEAKKKAANEGVNAEEWIKFWGGCMGAISFVVLLITAIGLYIKHYN
jgi:hypothetical protein